MDPALVPRLTALLRDWEGRSVSVRVVAGDDELLAVFAGRLGARSETEEHPPWFWPLEADGEAVETVERRGLYVHPELLSDVRVHVGESVFEYVQAGVTVNVRLLERTG